MSDTTILAGRHGLPSNVPAGTVYNPIAGPTTNKPFAFPVGTPVSPSQVDAHTVRAGNASDPTLTRTAGLASTPGIVGKRVNIETQGVLTLTTAQWDAITGDVGGLARGVPYFLSAGADDGELTQTAPDVPGDFVVRVGVALSATDFLILICCPAQVPPAPGNG